MRQETPSTAGHRRRRGCGCCGCPGCAVAFVLVLWTVTAVWHGFKPLPDGLRTTGPRIELPAAGVTLLEDVAGVDGNGEPFHTAEIFDRVLARMRRPGASCSSTTSSSDPSPVAVDRRTAICAPSSPTRSSMLGCVSRKCPSSSSPIPSTSSTAAGPPATSSDCVQPGSPSS